MNESDTIAICNGIDVSRQLYVLDQILRSLNSTRIRKRSYYRDADTLADIAISVESLSANIQRVLPGPEHPQWNEFANLMNQIMESLQWFALPNKKRGEFKKHSNSSSKRSSGTVSTGLPSPMIVSTSGESETKYELSPPTATSLLGAPGASFYHQQQQDDEYLVAAQLASLAQSGGNQKNRIVKYLNSAEAVAAEDVLLECDEEMILETGESMMMPHDEYIPYLPEQDSGGSSSWATSGGLQFVLVPATSAGDVITPSISDHDNGDPYAVGFVHAGGLSPFKPYNREEATIEAASRPKPEPFWAR
jgi:hypothetical protein